MVSHDRGREARCGHAGLKCRLDEYENDRLYFLKKQIECLQTYKHNLTKIIFLFNIEPDQYHLLSKVFDITPKHIQGAEVEIIIRKNVGLSYGAWSDTFKQYKKHIDTSYKTYYFRQYGI